LLVYVQRGFLAPRAALEVLDEVAAFGTAAV
jgi:hypothetical protein